MGKNKTFTINIPVGLYESINHSATNFKVSKSEVVRKTFENLKFLYGLMGDKFAPEKGKNFTEFEMEKIKEIKFMVS